jgi:hypothetical protein
LRPQWSPITETGWTAHRVGFGEAIVRAAMEPGHGDRVDFEVGPVPLVHRAAAMEPGHGDRVDARSAAR